MATKNITKIRIGGVDYNIQDASAAQAVEAEATRAKGEEAKLETKISDETTAREAAISGLESKITEKAGDIKMTKLTDISSLGTNVKEAYQLVNGTTPLGVPVLVYKDQTLKSVALVNQKLQFVYILANGSESTVEIDLSKFLAEAEFKNGLAVSADGEVSVKIAVGSQSNLSVDENGLKLSGVAQQSELSALETKVNGLQTKLDNKLTVDEATGTLVIG